MYEADPGGDVSSERTLKPKPLHKTMARKAHRAAGIWAGIVTPAAQVTAANEASLRSTELYKANKLTLLREAAASAAATLMATENLRPPPDMVALSEIVDVNTHGLYP